jgi:response regulator RpfG family c-di-GMP phosphodiesterase
MGAGSQFTIRLPLLSVQPPLLLGPTNQPSHVLRPRRVMVVDDNRDAAQSLGLLLRLLGAQVQVAHSGPEALNLLPTYRPQVIVMDIGMPGMDGQAGDRRRSQAAGFDHHLVKPADVGALEKLLISLEG